MAITTDEQTAQLWTSLISTFQSEVAPGKRLAGVTYIAKSAELSQQTFPAIAVQLVSVREMPYASRRHQVNCVFKILVAAEAPIVANAMPTLDSAMAALQAYIADGTGNGVNPILRDVNNRALGGANAYRGMITGIDYNWEIREGADPRRIAYGLITYETQGQVII